MANEMAKVVKVMVESINGKRPVDTIVTHIRPHFDEVLAVYLLKVYGKSTFLGVEDAGIETWGEGKMLKEYADKTSDDLLKEQRILCVGTCGGMFDEHGNGEETCAHLVARYLGVADKPELQKILQFCKRVDHDGKSMPFDLHSTAKEMYDFFGDGDEGMQTVFNWIMQAIESHVSGQRQFHACADEFGKTGRVINGGPIKIALVESDCAKMNKWIRYVHSTDVIVQKKSSGNMIILTMAQRVKKVIDMRDLVRVVRMMELQKRRRQLPSWHVLEATGSVDDCPWWYYYANGEQLLNGTPTSPEVEPSALTLDEVAQAIAISCAPRVDPCKIGSCLKTCIKYQFGLIACRQKRFSEIEKK